MEFRGSLGRFLCENGSAFSSLNSLSPFCVVDMLAPISAAAVETLFWR